MAPTSCWNWGERGLKKDWKGSLLGWFVGLVVQVQENLSCFRCSSRPSTKYFFLTLHFFNSFVPNAQQAGQAAVLGRLSPSVCLCIHPPRDSLRASKKKLCPQSSQRRILTFDRQRCKGDRKGFVLPLVWFFCSCFLFSDACTLLSVVNLLPPPSPLPLPCIDAR